MKITPTKVDGVMLLDLEPIKDDRGYFARAFCADTLASAGHAFEIQQTNLSYNAKKGTLRGMHYQAEPTPDPKIVRCERGRIFDVAVDIRPSSPTYLSWTGTELNDTNGRSLLIPAGCAHGFMSLSDNTQVLYLMGAPYVSELARGIRWNDPTFAIDWPHQPSVISERDATYADYETT